MRIGIISTGDELLRGEVVDTNAAWLAAELHERGLTAGRISVVGDDLHRLTAELGAAFEHTDLVLVGGGLGPTGDDITAAAAARAAGVDLARDRVAESQVRQAFDRLGREMNEINLKQADLPAGSRVLSNPVGTAPGFALDTPQGGRALFFPGVPAELEPMFDRHATAELPTSAGSPCVTVLKCFGMGESDIQAALAPLLEPGSGVRLAFRASFPEIRLTFTADSGDALDPVARRARETLGRAVYAEQDIGLPTALVRELEQHGLTAAVAESCTGGLIGHSITEVPGSSAAFRGGIVAYDNEVKSSILSIDRSQLAAAGAVSEAVVVAMAQCARRVLEADLALATSGIAGPDGGSTDKPVGLVHMAVAHPGGVRHRRHVFKGYSRTRVKRAAAWTTMRMALDIARDMA
jgi:nicotinamide-nucleotide amidase